MEVSLERKSRMRSLERKVKGDRRRITKVFRELEESTGARA